MSTYFIRDQTIDPPYAADRPCPTLARHSRAACNDGFMTGGDDSAGAFSCPGGAGNDVGVLLCHGFTGSPTSMRPWAHQLAAAGFAVRLPLLPGHGTRWQDMNSTTFSDWLGELTAALVDLTRHCRAVVVAGLSMGGTLALRLAELHGERIAGLILVNPSVMTTRTLAKFAPILKRIQPLLIRVLPSLDGITDDIAKPGVLEGGYDRIPVAAALSLQTSWSVVRRDLPLVKSPLLLLHSIVDHVVEPANSAIVLAEVSSTDRREVLLEKSYHVATLDYDADLIFAESMEFINRVTAP